MIWSRRRTEDLHRAAIGAGFVVAAPLAYGLLLVDAWRTHAAAPRATGSRRRLIARWWLWVACAGAFAMTLAAFVADGLSQGAVAALWVALLALVGVTTRAIATGRLVAASHHRAIAIGALAAGLAVCAYAVSEAWSTGARVGGWAVHPNIWGAHLAAGFVVALAVVDVTRSPRAHAMVALLGVVTITTTGSRSALVAMLVGILATWIVHLGPSWLRAETRKRWLRALLWLTTLAVVSGVAIVAVPAGSRMLPIPAERPANRLVASEDLTHGAWTRRDVTVQRLSEGTELAVHLIRSEARDGLARLHQRQLLRPGEPMTFSVELGPGAPHAGLVAFDAAGGRLQVGRDGSIPYAPATPRILAMNVEPRDEGWTLLVLSVEHDGHEPLVWRVGVAPTLHAGEAASVTVRRLSLVPGTEVGSYVGTTPEDDARARADLSAARRLDYVPMALTVARERWLFGHGRSSTFADLVAEIAPGRLSASDRPVHPHNLLLDLLVTHGAIGLTGFGLLLLGWWGAVPRQARAATVPFVVTLVLCNLADATLLTGGPEYAALALLLWWHRTVGPCVSGSAGSHA